MSLIHLSEKSRDAFFAHLVGKSFNTDGDERGEYSITHICSRGALDSSKNKVTSFLPSTITPKSLSPHQDFYNEKLNYANMTFTCFAEELVDELNYGGKNK